MRGIVRVLVVVVGTLVIPHTALAQAVIAGSVKDTSGAVLPGVTVEAASPVLIEKVRSAVSDGSGVYRIEDLRPGTYTVTITLPASQR
jgi:Carboxypeptidase regulatory-like domain